jgi:hypothetical protein
MPRPEGKRKKPGRNEPCWCGSGKKYKDCHLPIEEEQRTRQRKLRQAQDTLLPKIMEAAESMPEAFPAAFAQFWQEKYTPEQMSDLDDLEDRGAERFLTWFAFDFVQDDGHTLVEMLSEAATEGRFEVDEFEAHLLNDWGSVRLRPYTVEEVKKGQGFLLRDMLNQNLCHVEEHAASRRVLANEVLVGHLVPVDMRQVADEAGTAQSNGSPSSQEEAILTYYVAGAIAQLTADTSDTLTEFANLHLEDLRRTQPDATLDSLPRQRSQIFNHFVMELPEEYNPSVLDDVLLRARTSLHFAGILPMAESGGADEDESDESTDDEPEKTEDKSPNT